MTLAEDQKMAVRRRADRLRAPISALGGLEALFAPQAMARRAGIPLTDMVTPGGLLILGTFISGLISLMLPLAILQVYDRIIPTGATATLDAIVLILVPVFLLDCLLRHALADLRGTSAAEFAARLTQEALGRLLHAPAGSLNEQRANTEERLLGIARLASHFASSGRQAVVELPFAALYLAAIAVIGGAVVWVPLGLMLVFGCVTAFQGNRLRRLLDDRQEVNIAWSAHWHSVLGAIQTVKAMGMERLMLRRAEPFRTKAQRLEGEIAGASDIASAIAGALGAAAPLAVVSAGAILAADTGLSIGEIAACSLLSGRAVQPILRLGAVWSEHQSFRVTLQSVAGLFALPPAPGPRTKPDSAPIISVRRAGGDWAALARGGVLHVEGGSIAERRNFIEMLAGQQPDSDQEILIDACHPAEYRRRWSDAIAIIGRDFVPFTGTLRDNLTGFDRRASLDDAIVILEKLLIADDLMGIPDGLDTQLGRNLGRVLSRSLMQGIGIARVLAGKPRLIILDDPIDVLDPLINVALSALFDELRGQTSLVFVGPDLPPGLEADLVMHLDMDANARN